MIKIMIDDVPPSLNRFAGRKNAWEYREVKETWTKLVWASAVSQRPPRAFDKAIVRIIYRFPDKRRRDPDNYNGKFLLDGLTQAGIIADDSFQHITLQLSAEAKPGAARTTIEVEEIK